MSSKLIRDLKTLFHTFIYYKEDDETNLHEWINEDVIYDDGVFVHTSTTGQEVNVNFVTYSTQPYYRTGELQVNVTPGVSGQNVNIVYVKTSDRVPVTVQLTTNGEGYCSLSDNFYGNFTAHIIVDPITVNGVRYDGDYVTYEL